MNHWATRYGYKNSGKEILEHAKYDSGNGRYACVNLTNYDTIEFRAFRGTLKYNTLIATLQFVERICKVTLCLSEEEIQDLGWPQPVLLLTDESTPELIQYLKERWLHIFKRAGPASCVPLFPPAGVHAIMGHVRMTTQGNARFNYNNHPFPGMLDGSGKVKGPDFAMAHNGVLQNDRDLRLRLHLPETKIEADSYVAVQMLEALGTLDLSTLQEVAEQLEGTFTLTLLDRRDTLYFVRGNNLLYLVEFPQM